MDKEFSIARLSIKPGDKLVIKVKGIWNDEIIKIVGNKIREWAGDIPILIMNDDMDMVIVGKD